MNTNFEEITKSPETLAKFITDLYMQCNHCEGWMDECPFEEPRCNEAYLRIWLRQKRNEDE